DVCSSDLAEPRYLSSLTSGIDPLRVVVPLIATAPVEEVLDPKPAAEQIDARRQRGQIPGLSVATENRVRADEDLVERRVGVVGQDAVAVLVLPPENRAREQPANRIALGDPVRGADLARRAAEAHDLVRVERR